MNAKKTFVTILVVLVTTLLVMPVQAENVLRWGVLTDPRSYDVHSYNAAIIQRFWALTYEALVEKDPKLNFIPSLATEWKPIDQTTWEFKLRRGIKYHNGAPFSAEDVIFSINRAKAPSSNFKKYVHTIKEVIAKDDYTVLIKTKGPNPMLPNQLSIIYIMDKDWCEKHGVVEPIDYPSFKKGKTDSYAVRHANGTGAFKLELYEPDIRVILVKNENWWGLKREPHHNLDKVIVNQIVSNSTRVAALLSGELDFITGVSIQDLPRIEKNPGTHVEQVMELRTIFYMMDTQSPELSTCSVKGKNPLADKRVRQAIYQAIDIEAIEDVVMRGSTIPAGMLVAPGVFGYNEEQGKRLPYDPEASKRLLAEAGYPDGFSFTLSVPKYPGWNSEGIGQATIPMLARVGINARLDVQPGSKYWPGIFKGEHDFYLMGYGTPTVDSQYVLETIGEKSRWNPKYYSHPDIIALNKKISTELDPQKRLALIKQAWQIFIDDIAVIPLHYLMLNQGVRDNVKIPLSPSSQHHVHWGRIE